MTGGGQTHVSSLFNIINLMAAGAKIHATAFFCVFERTDPFMIPPVNGFCRYDSCLRSLLCHWVNGTFSFDQQKLEARPMSHLTSVLLLHQAPRVQIHQTTFISVLLCSVLIIILLSTAVEDKTLASGLFFISGWMDLFRIRLINDSWRLDTCLRSLQYYLSNGSWCQSTCDCLLLCL